MDLNAKGAARDTKSFSRVLQCNRPSKRIAVAVHNSYFVPMSRARVGVESVLSERENNDGSSAQKDNDDITSLRAEFRRMVLRLPVQLAVQLADIRNNAFNSKMCFDIRIGANAR